MPCAVPGERRMPGAGMRRACAGCIARLWHCPIDATPCDSVCDIPALPSGAAHLAAARLRCAAGLASARFGRCAPDSATVNLFQAYIVHSQSHRMVFGAAKTVTQKFL